MSSCFFAAGLLSQFGAAIISYLISVPVVSGVFRISQRGGHGERAEREPIRRVWGRSPQRGPGAEPLVGGSAETLFASECSMETANLPIFLKFGNAKDHQTLLDFAILAEKWQKMHLFI